MKIQKLESINAFVAVDLEGVPGRGVLRASKKILQGGAKDLARSMTYGLASLNLKETGVSAGISTPPEEKSEAIKTFFEEISEWENKFSFTAGLGVTSEDTAENNPEEKLQLLAIGTLISALTAKPDASTAVIDDKILSSVLEKELTKKGIEIIHSENPFTEKADILFCGSKMGVIDHEIAEKLSFSVIAPTSALPVTTRAVAVCKRRKILALPDFITTAGPLINDKNLTEETLSSIVDEIIDHDDGPLLGACERAEVFLAKWQSELPFGRPMAS
jgi:glutamate dehydrogenase/leucine dehydrogenase